MTKPEHIRVIVTLFMMMSIIFSLVGCGTNAQSGVTVSYTLPFLPITFALDSNGNISVSATASIVTELGEFAVSAGSAISAMSVPNDSLMLTIRHYQNGNLVDTVYQINTGEVGSADIQGNISEVKVSWNGQSNSIFVDASNGDISSITIQGTASSTTSNVPASTVPTNPPTPVPTFQCPDASQVSSWMNVSVSQVTYHDLCAFTAGNNGQVLSGVICTNQDGGTVIEYNTVDQSKVLVVTTCAGNQLPDIYGFTIRFDQGYSQDATSLCNSVARQAPPSIPSDWTVQANC